MDANTQTIINIAFGICGFLGGFMLKALWDSIKDLQSENKKLIAKIGDIEVLVAGEYVKSDKFDTTIQLLFAKLDKIEGKIDRKVDKP